MSRRRDRNRVNEPWIGHRLSLRVSPAWRHLPDDARRVLDRLEVEHCKQGGAANGQLTVTYDQLEHAGIRRRSIALAIRQCEALGFVEVTFRAEPAAAEHRRTNRYRLTHLKGRGVDPTHEWAEIRTEEEARAALDRAATIKSAGHVRRARTAVARVRVG